MLDQSVIDKFLEELERNRQEAKKEKESQKIDKEEAIKQIEKLYGSGPFGFKFITVGEPQNELQREFKKHMNPDEETYLEMLTRLIDQRIKEGMYKGDPEIYNKGNISKQVHSSAVSKDGHIPSKNTLLKYAITLKLDLKQTEELLKRAGYTLIETDAFDYAVRMLIGNHRMVEGDYNVVNFNIMLENLSKFCPEINKNLDGKFK